MKSKQQLSYWYAAIPKGENFLVYKVTPFSVFPHDYCDNV